MREKGIMDDQQFNDLNARVQNLERRGMNSNSFFTRAFSVWGYYFMAQLVISLVMIVIFFAIGMIFGISSLSN